MGTIKDDIESVAAFTVFPIVYLSLVTYETRSYIRSTSYGGDAEQREQAFALALGYILVATLIASMGHVLALGWVRSRFTKLRWPFLLALQVAVAAISVAILRTRLPIPMVFVVPCVVTLAVYGLVERLRNPPHPIFPEDTPQH
jgi:hypothetical protein